MEKEENQNTATKNHQEPEKETAKPEKSLDIENKEEKAQEAKATAKEHCKLALFSRPISSSKYCYGK